MQKDDVILDGCFHIKFLRAKALQPIMGEYIGSIYIYMGAHMAYTACDISV